MNPSTIPKNEKAKDLDNLKSDYFLIKLFDFIKLNKSLKIMKYNKKLQERLNININDYKECSKIEIELKLCDNKHGYFIQIPDKDKEYYHIYFDNSKEEVKRNKLKKMKTLK